MTSSLGQSVGEYPVEAGTEIDVTALAPGVYYLRLFDGDDRALGQARFVKQ